MIQFADLSWVWMNIENFADLPCLSSPFAWAGHYTDIQHPLHALNHLITDTNSLTEQAVTLFSFCSGKISSKYIKMDEIYGDIGCLISRSNCFEMPVFQFAITRHKGAHLSVNAMMISMVRVIDSMSTLTKSLSFAYAASFFLPNAKKSLK